MSALIKALSTAAPDIHAITPAERDEYVPVPSEADRLGERIKALEAEIAEAERRLPDLLAEARADARREAFAKVERDDALKLDAYRDGMDRALGQWAECLATLDRLAADLSMDILERVFGDDERRTELVTAALKRRLRDLDTGSLVGLRVSPEDFPGGDMIAQLKAALGSSVEVSADDSLETGECAIDLTLGQIDAGPGAQWRRVRAFLDELGEAAT